ncbi:MAG: hypothetical protein DRI24_22960, partial [Deltaproteobacteria bacterium]
MAGPKPATISSVEDLYRLNADEIRALDPSKINFGTCMQDCILITQTYERAAHATASESAVFATLSRSVQNSIAFSETAQESLKTYLQVPQEASAEQAKQASDFASSVVPEPPGSKGESAPTQHSMQSLNMGDTKSATHGESFGDQLLNWARECIPCEFRVISLAEITAHTDLLEILQADLYARLKILIDIGKLLGDFDSYGDFCDLINMLSFMCIPDLQRIIALLMSLLMLEMPELDGLIGMLQSLVMPIFSPILMTLSTLLDQFVRMVTDPMECIIDALNLQRRKLEFDAPGETSTEKLAHGLSDGIGALTGFLDEAKAKIEDKIQFYLGELRAMLQDLNGGDAGYLLASVRKLQIVRFTAFVAAIIRAMAQGHSACNPHKTAEAQEIDNFFNSYVNPNA